MVDRYSKWDMAYPSEYGEYVKYEDYEKLEQEFKEMHQEYSNALRRRDGSLDRQDREIEMLRKENEYLLKVLTDIKLAEPVKIICCQVCGERSKKIVGGGENDRPDTD